MANTDMRMYIGARYVPRFMGQHVASQAYEGLDVVDDGVSVAYIAKKPVPVNTPLSNTEYWMVYFTYGGIEDLQRQIDDMKDGTVEGSLQSQIDATNAEITDMKDGTVAGSLQSQITANDNDIADMKNGSVTGSLQSQINGETVQLAPNITLYRLSSLRILSVKGANINTLTGLTLDAADRPSNRLTEAIAYYGFLGRFVLQSDGSMSFYQYQTYGDNTATDISSSTATVNFSVCWTV